MKIPDAIRKLVIRLRKDGLCMKRIREITKTPKSIVQYIIKRHCDLDKKTAGGTRLVPQTK